jgi:hypothetical protein
VKHNRKKHAIAVHANAFLFNKVLISRIFRRHFILDPASIGWQLELIARLTPSTLETLPGETPVKRWSVDIPEVAWVEVLTSVSILYNGNLYFLLTLLDQVAHVLGEWEPGRWEKNGFSQTTTQINEHLHGFAGTNPAPRLFCNETAQW